jgi:hypothetical protein
VARYYRSDLGANVPVSNEITGYAVSTFSYLYRLTGDPRYREAALGSARFLADRAWDGGSHTFPFEVASELAYFFDVGIIVRGLLSTGEFRDRAREGAMSLALDFIGDGAFHPIIHLPDKQPLDYERQWSRSPGCYQLKSALAWLGIGDQHGSRMFDAALASALRTHEKFLPGDPDPFRVMDRLHPYCYFLEALLFVAERKECAAVLGSGIDRVAGLLRDISPRFERSDVCAQLLRVRLAAHHLQAVPLDEKAAAWEAERVARYQARSEDPRLDGGFWFGSKGEEILPYMNPVSTGFSLQALALWEQHRAGAWTFELSQII